MSFERTIHKNREMFINHPAFFQEYLSLGHLGKVLLGELNTHPHFYLPHRCVAKDDSTTTKLLVVFDSSTKTCSGLFLKDCLMVSPEKQDDILDSLICF